MDLEQRPVAQKQLVNTNVRSIAWRGVTVTVNDRKTKQSKTIVDNVEGTVNAGSFILSGLSDVTSRELNN
ncbi:hypothetical protein V500_00768 [Pseudogymnoascus sp. VKM F-4518 (FW-2643)]|nr:hypothetical protein V500_00768 [Pseudogymnoascus sp. VKM F-4518 (FW-2643)]